MPGVSHEDEGNQSQDFPNYLENTSSLPLYWVDDWQWTSMATFDSLFISLIQRAQSISSASSLVAIAVQSNLSLMYSATHLLTGNYAWKLTRNIPDLRTREAVNSVKRVRSADGSLHSLQGEQPITNLPLFLHSSGVDAALATRPRLISPWRDN